MDNNKEDKSHLDNIRKKIDDLFKDGKIIFDGPISVRDKFWEEVKNSREEGGNFINYLREERDRASRLAEVSNDPSFWLGRVDAFLDVENKVLSILKKYKEK